jgi:hypothetical protein
MIVAVERDLDVIVMAEGGRQIANVSDFRIRVICGSVRNFVYGRAVEH